MKTFHTIAALVVLLLAVSCSSTITGKPVGKLTLEEAVRLHMTKPTVIEWLQKTDAQAVYFPQQKVWKINLQDGWIFYSEYKDEKGVLWVDAIDPRSDDPGVLKRLEVLGPEYEKAMRIEKK